MPLIISSVGKKSIFKKYGIEKGDRIISINNSLVYDFFGVMYEMEKDEMVFSVKNNIGALTEIKVRRKDYKDILCEFEDRKMQRCANKCIFCFIDQNPPALRKELYFKDDDYRESLTCGNFITLSNTGKELLQNIIEHKLSPLYVSIHSSEDKLRKKIFGRDNPIDKVQYLLDNNIKMHFQIVLMKGVNDCEHLIKTLNFAEKNKAVSVGIVPVGVTKFRKNLAVFKDIDKKYAMNLIDSVESWKKSNSFKRVYLADEFYLKAEMKVPSKGYYREYPQLENGIGMVRLFEEAVKAFRKRKLKKNFAIITGASFGEYLKKTKCFEGERIYPLENVFLGKKVTETGLLFGRDILNGLEKVSESGIIVYKSIFNTDGVTLDNYSREDIERQSGKKINVINEFEEIQEYLV